MSRLEPGVNLNDLQKAPFSDPASLIRVGAQIILSGERDDFSFEFSVEDKSSSSKRVIRVELTPVEIQSRGCQVVLIDVTERRKANEGGTFLAKLEKLTSETSLRLATCSSVQIDENIRTSLRDVSLLVGVDYAFVSKFHKDSESGNEFSSMTHFWHPNPPKDFYERFQKLPLSDNPHRDRLQINESVILTHTEQLPDRYKNYRDHCQAMGAKSVVSVPIFVDGSCYGYVGFVTITQHHIWTDREVMILRVLSEIYSGAFSRQRIEETLREREKSLLPFYQESESPTWCFSYHPPIPTDLPVEKQYEMLLESYFSDCNDAAAALVGLKSRADVVGVRTSELFGGAPTRSYSEMLKKFIRDGYRCIDARVEIEQPDGSIRIWLHQGQGVVQDGMLLRSWVSTRDITDLVMAEDLASKQNAYRNSGLTENEILKYVVTIEKVMKVEQPYLDPGFNLSKLSKLIRLPDYQVSQILNMGMKESFYDLINRYRIEHLVDLLSKPEHDPTSILDLAFQVGFNSKSTFNIAFKKITGKTPSTYRMQLQERRIPAL
jgi:AraC-like DNA-binding protein